MTARLVWPALTGGAHGPGGWALYDGASGVFKAMTLDALRETETALRSNGQRELADAFGEQLAWLITMAEIWASSNSTPGVAP